MVRATFARTPESPVTVSAKASSAAESTTPPPEAPPDDGRDTDTPRREATAWTAASIRASTPAAFDGASTGRVARSPSRVEAPSRVPRTISMVTCEAQPPPSCHVPVTRSPMRDALAPAAPKSLRVRSLTASDRTAPKGL